MASRNKPVSEPQTTHAKGCEYWWHCSCDYDGDEPPKPRRSAAKRPESYTDTSLNEYKKAA